MRCQLIEGRSIFDNRAMSACQRPVTRSRQASAPGTRSGATSMPNDPSQSPERLLRTYFHAKDENRPHLIAGVFSESATLEMVVKTTTISFPPSLTRHRRSHRRAGSPLCADVRKRVLLLSRLSTARCRKLFVRLAGRHVREGSTAPPAWAVAVTTGTFSNERRSRRSARHYHRSHAGAGPRDLPRIITWLTALPYPWCSASSAIGSAPAIDDWTGPPVRGAQGD